MKKTIRKNHHRPCGLPAFLSPMGVLREGEELIIRRSVKFDTNCIYDLKDADQYDWNKLFGCCFGMFGIHHDSVRFGWRWNVPDSKMDISVLLYENGVPTRNSLIGIPIDTETLFTIKICRDDEGAEIFMNMGDNCIFCKHMKFKPKWYFGCGLYFGGNRKAPHNMSVYIKRK